MSAVRKLVDGMVLPATAGNGLLAYYATCTRHSFGPGCLRKGFDVQEEYRRVEHIHVALVAEANDWTPLHRARWHLALDLLPRGKDIDEFVGACKDGTGLMGFRDLLMVADLMGWGYERCVYVRDMGPLMATALTSGALLNGAGTVKTRPTWTSWTPADVGTGGGRVVIAKWITPPGQRVMSGETITVGVSAFHINGVSAVNFSWANATEQAVTSLSYVAGVGWGYWASMAQADAGGIGYGALRARAIPTSNGTERVLQWDGTNNGTEFYNHFDNGTRGGATGTIPQYHAYVDWATGNDATAVATHITQAAAEAATPFKRVEKAIKGIQAAMLASAWGQRDGGFVWIKAGWQQSQFDTPLGGGSPTASTVVALPHYIQPATGATETTAILTGAAFMVTDDTAVSGNTSASLQVTAADPATGTTVLSRNGSTVATLTNSAYADTDALADAITAVGGYTVVKMRNIPLSGAASTDSTLAAATHQLTQLSSGTYRSTPCEINISRSSNGYQCLNAVFQDLTFSAFIINEAAGSTYGTYVFKSCTLKHPAGSAGNFAATDVILVASGEFDKTLGWCCFYQSAIQGVESHSSNTRMMVACTLDDIGDIVQQNCMFNLTLTNFVSVLGSHADINQYSTNTANTVPVLTQGISLVRVEGVTYKGGQGIFVETLAGATGNEQFDNFAYINMLLVSTGQNTFNVNATHVLACHFTHTYFDSWTPNGGPSFLEANVIADPANDCNYSDLRVRSCVLISASMQAGGTGTRPTGPNTYSYCYFVGNLTMSGVNVSGGGSGETLTSSYTGVTVAGGAAIATLWNSPSTGDFTPKLAGLKDAVALALADFAYDLGATARGDPFELGALENTAATIGVVGGGMGTMLICCTE